MNKFIRKCYRFLEPDSIKIMDMGSDKVSNRDREACEKEVNSLIGIDKVLPALSESWGMNDYCTVAMGYSEGYYGVSYLAKPVKTVPSCCDKIKDALIEYFISDYKLENQMYINLSVRSDDKGNIYIGSPDYLLIVEDSDFNNPKIDPRMSFNEIPSLYRRLCKLLPEFINTALDAWSKKTNLELSEIDLIFPLDPEYVRDYAGRMIGVSNAMSLDSEFYEDSTVPNEYRMAFIYYDLPF